MWTPTPIPMSPPRSITTVACWVSSRFLPMRPASSTCWPPRSFLSDRFKDRYKTRLVTEAAKMRPRNGSDPVIYTTNLVIRNLARRIKALNTEMKQIDRMLILLLEQTAPSLLALYGLGPDTAASLLVAAGDNADRIGAEGSWARLCGVTPIPAGSGKTSGRFRLNRGGDRQANAAL